MSGKVYTPVHDQTNQVRAVLAKLPAQATYPSAQALWMWRLVAALYGEVVRLVGRLHHPGENLDYGDTLTALTQNMNDKWDAIPVSYRLKVFAATAGGLPTVTFADAGYIGNLKARLDLLDLTARQVDAIGMLIQQDGESAIYDFLSATNGILRGIGSGLVKLPAQAFGAFFDSIPFGKVLLFAGGIWVVSSILTAKPGAARSRGRRR